VDGGDGRVGRRNTKWIPGSEDEDLVEGERKSFCVSEKTVVVCGESESAQEREIAGRLVV